MEERKSDPVAPTIQALINHVFVEGMWKNVKRRAEAELVAELANARFTSFPFISPDTFRSLADVVIEEHQVRLREVLTTRQIVYFELAELAGTERQYRDCYSLTLLDQVLSEAALPPVLIMNNGDFLPSAELLRDLESRCHRIYAINLSVETEKLRAIPLGLENLYRNRNGRLEDFHQVFERPIAMARARMIFSAFSVENNKSVRGGVIRDVKNSRFDQVSGRISPQKFRAQVLDSKFVLSPPGRGIDCHRTWEAIYLGAIPVVLDGCLAPSLLDGLPLHAVSSYSDFLSLSDFELDHILQLCLGRSKKRAYMHYWTAEIWRASN